MSLPTREEFLRHLEEAQSDDECPVCYEVATVPVKTTCNHVFCRRCAKKCFASSNKCPYCRSKVSEELNPDPAFMHVHFLGSEEEEDDFVTFDLRDITQLAIGDKVILPPFWVVCRRPARADEPPDRLQIAITASGVHRHVAHDPDAAPLAAATGSLAQLEVEDLDESNQDETNTDDAGDGQEPYQDEIESEDAGEARGEDDTDTGRGYQCPAYAWFTCERHNFHLDEEIDEDVAKTAMTYLWGCQDRDYSPDLNGRVLLDYTGLFPRAIGVLLMIIPDRYIADDVEMSKWPEICLPDWKNMAQYLEYKLQELQDEQPQWQAREFKAELYNGWQAEMIEDDSDDEESDGEKGEDDRSHGQKIEEKETDQDTDAKEDHKEEKHDQGKVDSEESLTAEAGHANNHEKTHSSKTDRNEGSKMEDTDNKNVNSQEVNNEDDPGSIPGSERVPQMSTYSARVVETFSKGYTFEQNVNQLFDLITYFAQEHYHGLPYENWVSHRHGVLEVDVAYDEARVYKQLA